MPGQPDSADSDSNLRALRPARPPLMPERSDFLEGDAPAAAKVQTFLARALEAIHIRITGSGVQ